MTTPAENAVVVPEGPLPPLPPATWQSKEVRDAVAAESPGAVVAAARKAHGLRQDELGRLAGFSQSAISRLESGSNMAYDLRVLKTLQRLLGIPAHLLGLADRTVPVPARGVVAGLQGGALLAMCAGTVTGDVVAYCYVRLSQLAEADGDDDRVIGLARAAQRETGASPVVRAMAARQEGRGLARAGQESCLSRFELAAELVRAAERPQTDEYSIGYTFGAHHVDLQRAASLVDLDRPHQAIDAYARIMPRWGSVCQWEQGVHTARLAYAHAAAGDVDRAGELGLVALDLAGATGSRLVVDELGRLGGVARTPLIADVLADAARLR